MVTLESSAVQVQQAGLAPPSALLVGHVDWRANCSFLEPTCVGIVDLNRVPSTLTRAA